MTGRIAKRKYLTFTTNEGGDTVYVMDRQDAFRMMGDFKYLDDAVEQHTGGEVLADWLWHWELDAEAAQASHSVKLDAFLEAQNGAAQ